MMQSSAAIEPRYTMTQNSPTIETTLSSYIISAVAIWSLIPPIEPYQSLW